MNKVFRHGEILFVKTLKKNFPKIDKANQTEFLKGSHGNPHTFDNGELYLKKEDDYVFGYFKAKNTQLFHKEHSPKGCSLPDGYYQLRRQVEDLAEGLSPVID